MYVSRDRTTLWEIHQRILAACAYRKLPDDDSWLDSFKFLSFANKRTEDTSLIHSEQSYLQRAAFDLVEYAMDCLGHYAVKFNQCRVLGIKVDVTNPALVSELCSPPSGKASQLKAGYRGRLTAQRWTLIVRTNSQRVEFLLAPVEKVLNLSRFADDFQTLITLVPESENRQVRWRHENKTYAPSEMGPLFKETFKQLIERVYSQLNQDDFLKNPEDTSMTSNGFLLSEKHEPSDTGNEAAPQPEVATYHAELILKAEQEPYSSQELKDKFSPDKSADSPSLQEFRHRFDEYQAKENQEESATCTGEYFMEIQERVKIGIAELLNKEERILETLLSCGARAFQSSEFEKIENLLREAGSQKKRVEQLEQILTDWSDLSKMDLLLAAAAESNLDFNAYLLEPCQGSSAQIQAFLDSLMNTILQIGSRAFLEMKLELVQAAYKRVIELRKFQRRFSELSNNALRSEESFESLQLQAA